MNFMQLTKSPSQALYVGFLMAMHTIDDIKIIIIIAGPI